ncbi:hypothetical protein K0504_00030 [Neiella marina]|uniref:Uncharacterized protein n=1 Tax=Neiella holothuriorum TaxID=2870530 RepID=A0ABS7EAX6_9GAMM|nr:hypothetical protein [Neiella holothuriorum]MBW8189405.1 hypothetical protein [Neiella holothuriorum]
MATTVERRFAAQQISLQSLNVAQRSAFNALESEGYGLLFIRSTTGGKVAICSSGQSFATIDEAGQLDTCPSVDLRQG